VRCTEEDGIIEIELVYFVTSSCKDYGRGSNWPGEICPPSPDFSESFSLVMCSRLRGSILIFSLLCGGPGQELSPKQWLPRIAIEQNLIQMKLNSPEQEPVLTSMALPSVLTLGLCDLEKVT
jgi:hypothetical protein